LLGPAVAMAAVAIKNLRIIALWQLIYGLMAVALLLFRHEAFPDFIHRVVAFEAIAYGLYFLLMALAIWRYDHRQNCGDHPLPTSFQRSIDSSSAST
jgi:predicted transporter